MEEARRLLTSPRRDEEEMIEFQGPDCHARLISEGFEVDDDPERVNARRCVHSPGPGGLAASSALAESIARATTAAATVRAAVSCRAMPETRPATQPSASSGRAGRWHRCPRT